jgi:hypothetical protein
LYPDGTFDPELWNGGKVVTTEPQNGGGFD